jgi:hypothetical protein
MKKYRVLQLGLQLGFLIATDTCNTWYLYSLECYRTSCSNYNGHPMSYIILYIHCNSHATNLHVIFPHTFQHAKEMSTWHFIHLSTNDVCYYFLQLIYNYFTISLTNIISNYFIQPFEQWILFLYFITYVQLFTIIYN